jgi:hypothetical protein
MTSKEQIFAELEALDTAGVLSLAMTERLYAWVQKARAEARAQGRDEVRSEVEAFFKREADAARAIKLASFANAMEVAAEVMHTRRYERS